MKILSNQEYNDMEMSLVHAEHEKEMLEKKIESMAKDLKNVQDDFDLKEKKVVSALEDKMSKEISKLESAHNKDIMNLERRLTNEKMEEMEKMNKSHYKKLSDSMTKLHEEGNAQTKFMQEMTQTVIQSASGFAKTNNTTSTQIELKK